MVVTQVRVISYGLYGKSPRYTIGVLRNAQLAPVVYPGWKVHRNPAPLLPLRLVSLDRRA